MKTRVMYINGREVVGEVAIDLALLGHAIDRDLEQIAEQLVTPKTPTDDPITRAIDCAAAEWISTT
jgi:hypothetical protein